MLLLTQSKLDKNNWPLYILKFKGKMQIIFKFKKLFDLVFQLR